MTTSARMADRIKANQKNYRTTIRMLTTIMEITTFMVKVQEEQTSTIMMAMEEQMLSL
jgi:hypothetical protein